VPERADDALVPSQATTDADGADAAGAQLESAPAEQRSLYDDLEALLSDARTYVDAELIYQKSRAGFVANRFKTVVVSGIIAAFLAALALIGLTMGLIIALTPLVTAWGATVIVVSAILLIALLLVWRAGRAWKELTDVMTPPADEATGDTDEEQADNG